MKLLILSLLPAVALCQLAGGISQATVDPLSEPVVFAISEINQNLALTGGHLLSLVEITSAKTQVVQGQNLFLTLHMTNDYYCDVTIWYRSWLDQEADRLQMLDGPTCRQHHAAPRALGGIGGGIPGGVSGRQPLPTGDMLSAEENSVVDALNFAMCASNARQNSMYAGKLGDTSGVTFTQQVTSGLTYHFYDVPVVESTCRNTGCDNVDLASCPVTADGMSMMCHSVVVQFQAWMTPQYTITTMNCS